MAKNSPEGNRRRMAAQRARDRAVGIVSITVKAPEGGKASLHQAARLMREGLNPLAALRRAGASCGTPPQSTAATPGQPPWRPEDLAAALIQITERQAQEAERRRLADQGLRLEKTKGWRRWLIRRLLG